MGRGKFFWHGSLSWTSGSYQNTPKVLILYYRLWYSISKMDQNRVKIAQNATFFEKIPKINGETKRHETGGTYLVSTRLSHGIKIIFPKSQKRRNLEVGFFSRRPSGFFSPSTIAMMFISLLGCSQSQIR